MSIFRTIALFVYLFGYMIVHYSVLCKAERALAAGDTEKVRQLVKKHIPHWSKGILNVTGVRLSVEGRAVITTRLMMAVTVSEKPASLALPVSESVNLVEKIVIGAKEPSTMISRILMSNCRPRRDAGTVPCRQAAAWS